ncbi:MAG: insulinase family protein, partial [Ruminococcus sp.]|nr:insulinase family protein [Ruminococcus sp.]
KGVVFNEMKGALSSVNDKVEYDMNKLIFPDNCYRFNSGGDPAVIPDLTYEQYADTYRKFYHPSNSRFFLDGDIPLEDTLSMINSYLEKYEQKEIDFDVEMQTPVSNESTSYYEIDSEDKIDRRSILALGKIVGTWKEKTKITAAKVLCDVLADSNESPLKRAILSEGLADDVEMGVMDSIAQPYLISIIRNTEDSDSGKIRDIIRNTVSKLVNDGISKDSLHASINRLSFGIKQISEPQGLYRALSSYDSWLYGGDPLESIVFDDMITELRQMADGGDFEKLLSELMLDESGTSVLHMLPSYTLGEEERKTEENRLQKETSALSESEKDELIRLNENLSLWQQTPDSAEASATLPTLPLDCVDPNPEFVKTIAKIENDITTLYHPVETHGIVYLKMYFPLTNFNLKELTALSIYPSLLGEVPTEKRSIAKLQQDIKTYIGSLSFGLDTHCKENEADVCTPCFSVRAGILEENLEQAKELLIDILTGSQFNNPDKIQELVMQNDEVARQTVIGSGHTVALSAVKAHYTAKNAVNEVFDGYSSLKYIHDFAKNFDSMIDDFISLVQRLQSEAICSAGLTVSVTASKEVSFADLTAKLPVGMKAPRTAKYKTELPKRMGLRVPAQISYAIKGYNLNECGMKMDGSLTVASNIVSLSYLWNVVRVQGGAYGAGFPVGRDGTIACYSYRDPSPSRSLELYDTLSGFIDEFCKSDEDLDKYIISAVAGTEPLRTPSAQGAVADEMYFLGVTEEDRIKTRRQMLETDRKVLISWRGALEKMAEDGAVCVVGNDEALSKCDDLTVCEM